MSLGSKFAPLVMEKLVLTSPAEMVVCDYTILCSFPGLQDPKHSWESLSPLETQMVHLAIRAVRANWPGGRERAPGQGALERAILQGREKQVGHDSNLSLPQHLLIYILYAADDIWITLTCM